MPIDLTKRTENATISLMKTLQSQADKGNDLGEVSAQVVLVMDYSISMEGRYRNSEPQELAERCLALALSGLDDDGSIQTVMFHHDVFDPFTLTATNYSGAIDRWRRGEDIDADAVPPPAPVTAKKRLFGRTARAAVGTSTHAPRDFGGTDYLPAIKRVRQLWRTELDPKIPVLVLFVTDGETRNESAIKRALADSSHEPIFWQFLGLGYEPAFLRTLDTMTGRKVDNVGLTVVQDTLSMPDSEFFDEVTREYLTSWLPAARRQGITT